MKGAMTKKQNAWEPQRLHMHGLVQRLERGDDLDSSDREEVIRILHDYLTTNTNLDLMGVPVTETNGEGTDRKLSFLTLTGRVRLLRRHGTGRKVMTGFLIHESVQGSNVHEPAV